MGLRPLAPGGEPLAIVITLPFVGHLPRVCVLTILLLHPSYPSHCGPFFTSLVVDLFC